MSNSKDQDVWLSIRNDVKTPITIKNTKLTDGIFYTKGNKDEQLSPSDINELVAPAEGHVTIYSCGSTDGRKGFGTAGELDLYVGDVKICKLVWNDPVAPKRGDKEFRVHDETARETYIVKTDMFNPRNKGPLGTVGVKVQKRDNTPYEPTYINPR